MTFDEVLLSLYDANGVLVKTQLSGSPENIRLDVHDIPSGIYILRALLGNDQGIIRILKN
jgi:hypothetical protein